LVPITTVHDLQNLQLETRLNGELVQQANTSSMIFTVASLIAQLSAGTTLLEGTVILTGTPGGLGMNRTPMRFMRPGDVVEVSIEGVGQLRNPVVEQK
jgi:2-keto-4-pentenoate hydratase/2-oxohepta-3-ene-1,7-dioic acid hydratase in catechol pathway